MKKYIDITVFRDLFVIIPMSGGKSWFQEEASPEFYCSLAEGPEQLGKQIRQAEGYSRDFGHLGLKYPSGIMKMLSEKEKERHGSVVKKTGIKLSQLHKFDQNLGMVYYESEIILRFFQRAEDEKFNYRYINKNEADEPRLPRTCSDLELGQRIFDWAKTLDIPAK